MSTSGTEQVATDPLPVGTIARITRDVADLSGSRTHRAGAKVTVEEFVSADQGDAGIDYYWANTDLGLNDVCVPADALEEAMSATDAADRTLPTREQVLGFIGSHTLQSSHGVEVYETQMDCDERGTVSLVGVTDEGLRFHAVVSVVRVLHADF